MVVVFFVLLCQFVVRFPLPGGGKVGNLNGPSPTVVIVTGIVSSGLVPAFQGKITQRERFDEPTGAKIRKLVGMNLMQSVDESLLGVIIR